MLGTRLIWDSKQRKCYQFPTPPLLHLLPRWGYSHSLALSPSGEDMEKVLCCLLCNKPLLGGRGAGLGIVQIGERWNNCTSGGRPVCSGTLPDQDGPNSPLGQCPEKLFSSHCWMWVLYVPFKSDLLVTSHIYLCFVCLTLHLLRNVR